LLTTASICDGPLQTLTSSKQLRLDLSRRQRLDSRLTDI